MILAVHVIGSAIALIVLTIRLRDTRDQMARMRRERNTLLDTIETALRPAAVDDLAAAPPDGSGPPDLVHGERW